MREGDHTPGLLGRIAGRGAPRDRIDPVDLIYELLDSHDRLARLVATTPAACEGTDPEMLREADLEYNRRIQRLGREVLASEDPK